jgi:hypothetical protein
VPFKTALEQERFGPLPIALWLVSVIEIDIPTGSDEAEAGFDTPIAAIPIHDRQVEAFGVSDFCVGLAVTNCAIFQSDIGQPAPIPKLFDPVIPIKIRLNTQDELSALREPDGRHASAEFQDPPVRRNQLSQVSRRAV